MAIIDTRVARTTWHGTPLLDIEPFRAWVLAYMADNELTISEFAKHVGKDERRVRTWMRQPTVSERSVEEVGITLLADPRLVAQLYPEYDF